VFHVRLEPASNGGVGVAFTDRLGGVSAPPLGSLNLGRPDVDDPRSVAENFDRVRTDLGLRATVTVHQVHGTGVVVVDGRWLDDWGPTSEVGTSLSGRFPLRTADAMVTTEPGVGLCVRVADCVPVLLADPRAGVAGAAHAGRVGLRDGVLQATLAAIRDLGAADVTAWIGPSVCGSCYEVPEAMRAEVSAVVPEAWSTTPSATAALDLARGATAVLRRAGVRTVDLGACTQESADLHSHRRDGAKAGRMAGICWLG